MEVHDNPSAALSDPNTVINLKDIKSVLGQAKEIHEIRLKLKTKWGEDNVE